MLEMKEWDGFEGRLWKEEINVRQFIQDNYTPYDGNEDFLAGPTEATDKLWGALQKLQKEERAKGGVGLIMVENASVDSPLGSNGTTQIRIDHDNYMPRFFKLCETLHAHGACVGVQLNHAGASAQSKRTNMQPVSASDIPSKAGGEIPRPLKVEEIYEIVKKYGEAAARHQRSCEHSDVPAHRQGLHPYDVRFAAFPEAASAPADPTL